METTEVRAIHRGARISDQKAREVTRVITGMSVADAVSLLNFTPKKAALLVGKVLRSAVANAANLHEMDADDLYVKSAVATKGRILHRVMPRARGSSSPIRKRNAHITVVVAPKPEGFGEKKRRQPGSAAAAETAPAEGQAAPSKPRARSKKTSS